MTIEKVDAEKTELDVKYCIPEWLRDEQIKHSVSRYHRKIEAAKEISQDPIALVCFGPSLKETWEKVKDFKYVMSCSGSYKFLRERGITPTWHVEVDPRHHKIDLLGEDISQETEFLVASCCHPEYFEFLEKHGAKISIWHSFSGEPDVKIPNVYPRGEWILTGGANVGLRALTLTRFLGFVNVHIFGMDGSFPSGEGLKHADKHPNTPKKYILAEYNGKEYCTTKNFLVCARNTFHEIEMLPGTEVTFYGEGLVQEMAKDRKYNKKDGSYIAFFVNPTFSEAYAKLNRDLHEKDTHYGISCLRYVDIIKEIYEKTQSKSLLDYGCGKGMLAKNLDFPIWEYDPAIPGKDAPPRPADFVVCLDVLEHVEPDYLDCVLTDIDRCTKKICLFIIDTEKSLREFPDGRNTHLIQQGKEWWTYQINQHFKLSPGAVKNVKDKLIIVAEHEDHKSTKMANVANSKGEICLQRV